MSLTVSEIVERIAKPGQSKAALSERIRHWTRERLLSPVGKRNPGTGRHRVYGEAALQDAALLNAMADMQLPIRLLRIALAVASQKRSEWGKAKAKEGKIFFLQIDFPASGMPQARMHFGGSEEAFVGFGYETSLIFNLTQLFSRLQTGKE